MIRNIGVVEFYILLVAVYSVLSVTGGDDTSTSTSSPAELTPIQAVYAGVRQDIGFTAILKCIISTKNATGIVWTRNGSQVKGDTRHTVVKSSNNTARSTSLKIKSLESGDYGVYQCNANISGKSYSANVKLSQRKKTTPVRPQDKTVKQAVNSTASLKCILPKGANTISWSKNGTEVKSGEHFEILRSSNNKFRSTTLNIKSIQADDYGTYECKANISGKIQSASVKLAEKKSNVGPLATTAQVEASLKSNATLKCDFSKSPSEVSWWKNGTQVKSTMRTRIAKHLSNEKIVGTSLHIKSIEADDFGTYDCRAIKSDATTQTASIKLVEKKI